MIIHVDHPFIKGVVMGIDSSTITGITDNLIRYQADGQQNFVVHQLLTVHNVLGLFPQDRLKFALTDSLVHTCDVVMRDVEAIVDVVGGETGSVITFHDGSHLTVQRRVAQIFEMEPVTA